MIELTKLRYALRAIWGVCPVCYARPGEPCIAATTDDMAIYRGTHVARLINAPKYAALPNEET